MSALVAWGLAHAEIEPRRLALGAVRHAALRADDDEPSDEEIATAYALLLDRVAGEADVTALANALGNAFPGRGGGGYRARAEYLVELVEERRGAALVNVGPSALPRRRA